MRRIPVKVIRLHFFGNGCRQKRDLLRSLQATAERACGDAEEFGTPSLKAGVAVDGLAFVEVAKLVAKVFKLRLELCYYVRQLAVESVVLLFHPLQRLPSLDKASGCGFDFLEMLLPLLRQFSILRLLPLFYVIGIRLRDGLDGRAAVVL